MEFRYYREKVIVPALGPLVRRSRILDQLDAFNPLVTWITSPAGSGKTALATQLVESAKQPVLWYNIETIDNDPATFFNTLKHAAALIGRNVNHVPDITTDDLQHLRSFASYFFSCLKRCMGQDFVLVLDDYQHLEPGAQLHGLLVHATNSLAPEVRLIVTSREEMPAQWLKVEAADKLFRVTWEQLRVTLNEVGDFLAMNPRLRGRKRDAMLIRSLHDYSDGWVAGLKLLLTNLGLESPSPQNHNLEDGRQAVFHHFSSSVIAEMDIETREILLKVSILPFIPMELVNTYCATERASHVIRSFFEKRFFISRREGGAASKSDIFVLHDLLRDYLHEELNACFDAGQQYKLHRRAAELFQQGGWSEQALMLLTSAGEWQESLELIRSLGDSFLADGRKDTLQVLIEQLPPEYRTQRPTVEYWYGLCLTPTQLPKARAHHEAAYARFMQQGRMSESVRCWRAIIDTIWLEWADCSQLDRWIDELEVLRKQSPLDRETTQLLAMGAFSAMSLRRMDHPDMPYWEEMNLQTLDPGLPLNERIMRGLQMMIHYTWGTGEHRKSTQILQHLHYAMNDERCPEAGQCVFNVAAAAHDYWFSPNAESCLNHVETGLSTSAKHELPFWDVAMINVALYKLCSLDDIDGAKNYLEQLSLRINEHSHANDLAIHYHFHGYIAWLEGDNDAALDGVEKALALALSTGFSFSPAYYRLAIARILGDMGRRRAAFALLSAVRKTAIGFRSNNLLYSAHLVAADILYQSGEVERALRYARPAFAIGTRQRYYAEPWVKTASYLALCRLAAKQDADNEYLTERIALCDAGDGYASHVFTLGRFEITRRGGDKYSPRKQARVPTQLLAQLVAAGESKGVSTEALVDAIWPDTAWNKGYARLKTAILRLRQMLGNNQAITFRAGTVKLNRDVCRVDSWQFETLANDLPPVDARLTEEIFTLYQGAFCNQLTENSELVVYKSMLGARFEAVVDTLARHYRRQHDWEKVLDIYQQALKRDTSNEKFYTGTSEALSRLNKKKELRRLEEAFRTQLYH